MSHTRISIGVAEKGSTHTASRSGFRIMSDSLIAFQPSIEEPSNMKPSVSSSSPTTPATIDRCCHLPLGSVKRRSTHTISWFLIILRMSEALFAMKGVPFPLRVWSDGLDCVRPALAGADAHGGFDRKHEDLAVADAAGLRGVLDRLDHALGKRILDDDLELHLGQEVDDIFGAAIELGMALLAAEALGLGDGDARHTHLVQGFLHLVELERFDDRFDLLHRSPNLPGHKRLCVQ